MGARPAPVILGRKARGMPLPIGPQASSGAPRRKTRGSLFLFTPIRRNSNRLRRSEGLAAFLTLVATPSPFLALRAEVGRKLADAAGRSAPIRCRYGPLPRSRFLEHG